MSLKMKFAVAALVLSSSFAGAQNTTQAEVGEGMAVCSAVVNFANLKKLIEYPKGKIDGATAFFIAEGEKRIGDKFLPKSLQATFKISEIYADSQNATLTTQVLVSSKITSAAESCMNQYERSL